MLPAYQAIPEQELPDPERPWMLRTVDLGPDAAQGIGRYPAIEGEPYPAFVSDVDGDGNELAGIRLPDLTVPVGTHMGWNLRAPETGAPEQQMSMQGTTRFFAGTRAEREASSDPRPSVEERYASRDAYRERVEEATRALVADSHVLEEDAALVVENAMERYDSVIG